MIRAFALGLYSWTMLSRRTFIFLLMLLGGIGVLLLPAAIWPKYLDSPLGIALVFPYLSIYLFHALGIPGLLQHNGACGWGWCAPTAFGWVFLCAVWLAVAWFIAWRLAVAFPAMSAKTLQSVPENSIDRTR
jgi:hypothetical protein